MNLRVLAAFAAALVVGAPTLAAQQPKTMQTMADVDVRTFMLRFLDPGDAAKLITPYVDYTPGGGVFSAGSVRGITVRGLPHVLTRVDSILRANDRERDVVRLTFQVIAAYDSVVRDTSIAAIEKDLRTVLRFAGYQSIATGSLMSGEGFSSTSLSAQQQVFPVDVNIERIDRLGTGQTVQVEITLRASAFSIQGTGPSGVRVLSTRLTVPFGQSVIVGSGAPLRFPMGMGGAEWESQRALFLVVRAELAKRP